jgi:hypothetical protein
LEEALRDLGKALCSDGEGISYDAGILLYEGGTLWHLEEVLMDDGEALSALEEILTAEAGTLRGLRAV